MIGARQLVRTALMAGGWRLPVPSFLPPHEPVVLTYHGVPVARDNHGMCRDVFERHVAFLTQHFDVIPAAAAHDRARHSQRQTVVLTFDDGFRNHAEQVVPILRRHQVPATFFLPSRHSTPGRYLWFAYLKMLERYFPGSGFMFRGQFMNMSPGPRRRTMAILESALLEMQPHPTAMYDAIDRELPRLEDFVDRRNVDDECAGMTLEQIEELAADPLFDVGAHTLDHPLLTRCSPAEQAAQITGNKEWVERIAKKACVAIAYPGSEYDDRIVQLCQNAGFSEGYGGSSAKGVPATFDRERIGVFFPSLTELGVRVRWSRAISHWRRRNNAPPAAGRRDGAVESRHA
jgi:peptidoglycan/xylan/chitin deacetylase (PgdA/CDA1 family)